MQSQQHLSLSLAWDSNYSTRLLNFIRGLNTSIDLPQTDKSRILLHSSGNFFLRLEFPSHGQIEPFFPGPVPLNLTIHANISANEQPDGIKILWGGFQPVSESPVFFLSQSLLKESVKMASFRASLADQKEAMHKKKERLMSDLEVLVQDKEQMRQSLLKKSLLLINEKKGEIRELCGIVDRQKREIEDLQKEVLDLQAKQATKRRRKRVKQK